MNIKNKSTKTRQSNFELLRILAMFFIILYHHIIFFIEPLPHSSFFDAVQMSVHIGVVLFILISGYFGINPSIRGGGKLLLMCVLYYTPLKIAHDVTQDANVVTLTEDFFVISKTSYWFIKIYLLFYLFVPIVNRFLKDVNLPLRIYTLVILAIINCWFGCLLKADSSLVDGKNIINFSFIYIIGNTIRLFKPKLDRLKLSKIAMAYILLNISIILIYMALADTIVAKLLKRIAFGYNSPILILNALILFVCFVKLKFKSSIVNYISTSVFAVYLISDHPVIKTYVWRPLIETCLLPISNTPSLFFALVVATILVVATCIILDKILQPIWRLASLLPDYKIKS